MGTAGDLRVFSAEVCLPAGWFLLETTPSATSLPFCSRLWLVSGDLFTLTSILSRRWKGGRAIQTVLPWIPACAGATGPAGVTGTICFSTNRSCRLVPAYQGMKSGSCGLVHRIGTVDFAEPHPDPCGGQAPALHFLIPPAAIGLQFGTFRPWRAGIEVDWRAHPGSESGTCFRTNRSCRLAAAHQGVKIGCIG